MKVFPHKRSPLYDSHYPWFVVVVGQKQL